MKNSNNKRLTGRLLLATALSSSLVVHVAFAQDCQDAYDSVPSGCEQPNQSTVVKMTAEPNTEWDRGAFAGGAGGYLIAIDGEHVKGNPRLEDQIRKTDIALARADVQMKFDGLEAAPRLDLLIQHTEKNRSAGDQFIVQSRLNYPAFVERAEVRLIDIGEDGKWKMIGAVPIEANGAATIRLPEGNNFVAVHRVYDTQGRFDETFAIPLTDRDTRGLVIAVEEGTDATSVRNIPIDGGSVTVSSSNVAPGAVVRTLGETIKPTSDGRFAIQRILPVGEHDIDVAISGPGAVEFSRPVEIPESEWFYTGMADATIGSESGSAVSETEIYTVGRIAFYAKGRTASGYDITASLDTNEDELKNIFRDVTKKDPLSLAQRIDPQDLYPIYGDDSTIRDDTPTDGKLYLKVEKQGNYVLWGNYKEHLTGNALLNYRRNRYGAQAVWKTQRHTTKGDARAELELYASQSESLMGREIFQGTGGSVYFLQRQDVHAGSETLSIEVRDPVTRKIVSRRTLVAGVDYRINYFQGVVTLNEPLTSTTTQGVVVSSNAETNTVNLVAQYEYTPGTGSTDGLSAGGRLQARLTEDLAVGATILHEDGGAVDQEGIAADVLYEFGENSHARVDVARTSGPGFGAGFSTDGGLIINNNTPVDGTGTSVRAEIDVDASDVGLPFDGRVRAYAENRTEGFSTPDYQVTAATGDERLWGLDASGNWTKEVGWAVTHDNYAAESGVYEQKTSLEVYFMRTRNVRFDLGADFVESDDGVTSGRRTDLAGRLTFEPDDDREIWLAAQGTVSNIGLAENHRLGVGTRLKFAENWSGEAEIYDSSEGVGGKALLKYQNEQNDSLYFGYELAAGRQIGSSTLRGDDSGRLVLGGKRRVSERTSIFAENTYDLFGEHRSLTSAYGVDYAPTDHTSYSAAIELGRVNDTVDGDFDRVGFSLGTKYQTDNTTARAKLEFRQERGVNGGSSRDADTFILSGVYRREIDEERRVVLAFQAAHTETDQASIPDGSLVDLSFGYAYRPINNDRLNLLAKYRYFQDDYGQQIDGTATSGTVQRSHIASLDATYDINEHWSVGAKVGLRVAETAPNANSAYQSNNAVMATANVRYHVTHNWDLVAEARAIKSQGAQGTETGLLIAGYRHIGNNAKIGIGYNFGRFSDDLTNFSRSSRGPFLNVLFKF